ncbi:MAG: hypothetical protein K9J81_03510 [Desulfohalobiaceae bacterium]|nr:hypothetical protein [Desulfohalobiaceae bacterium]
MRTRGQENRFVCYTIAELDNATRKKLIQWHGRERAEKLYNQARRFSGAYGTGLFDMNQ